MKHYRIQAELFTYNGTFDIWFYVAAEDKIQAEKEAREILFAIDKFRKEEPGIVSIVEDKVGFD